MAKLPRKIYTSIFVRTEKVDAWLNENEKIEFVVKKTPEVSTDHDLEIAEKFCGWDQPVGLEKPLINFLAITKFLAIITILPGMAFVGYVYITKGSLEEWKKEVMIEKFVKNFPVNPIMQRNNAVVKDAKFTEILKPDAKNIEPESTSTVMSEEVLQKALEKLKTDLHAETVDLKRNADVVTEETSEMSPIETKGSIRVPAEVDAKQIKVVDSLKRLGVIDSQVNPTEVCSRRTYAKWLLSSSQILGDTSERILEAMYVEGSTDLGFADITVGDPDFGVIQGLAESGVIPSQLTRTEGSGPVYFRADEPLTREDLISWRVQSCSMSVPPGSVEELESKFGVLDARQLSESAASALLLDLTADSASSSFLSAFGYCKRVQANQVVTHQQAAASLPAGDKYEVVLLEMQSFEDSVQIHKSRAWEEYLQEMRAQWKADIDSSRKLLEEEKLAVVAKQEELQRAVSEYEAEKFTFDQEMFDLSWTKGRLMEELQLAEIERRKAEELMDHGDRVQIQELTRIVSALEAEVHSLALQRESMEGSIVW